METRLRAPCRLNGRAQSELSSVHDIRARAHRGSLEGSAWPPAARQSRRAGHQHALGHAAGLVRFQFAGGSELLDQREGKLDGRARPA